ncbi:hypothetical protein AB0E62_23490 [Streptomyces sp. NPDC038707]|uniref:hypothetical protein n=1 Tax=Streptomyces sp. NPDC038707 TaxID=3154329 RepID=UPI00340AD426
MARPGTVRVYELGIAERRQVADLLDDLLDSRLDPAEDTLYRLGWELPALLPGGVRRVLYELRTAASAPACLIRGMHIDDTALGEPPADGPAAHGFTRTRLEEMYLAVVSMGLAEAVGRGDRVVGDLLPTAPAGDRPLAVAGGAGPDRCDYLGLLSLRGGPSGTTLALAAVPDVRLAGAHAAVLRQPRFHSAAGSGPVLAGAPGAPLLCLDPFRATAGDGDHEAGRALGALRDGLLGCRQEIVLEPGDLLFVDTFQALVSGPAVPGGWLKTISLTRDPRRLNGPRTAATPARTLRDIGTDH